MELSWRMLITFWGVFAVAATQLQQRQEQLNVLGRSMLTTATEMQLMQEDVMDGLSEELVKLFVGVHSAIVEIYRTTGEFIQEYNMTDEYCIQVVEYMHWARALEAMESVQTCTQEIVSRMDKIRLTELLEQTRDKGLEVKMAALRHLSKSGDVKEAQRLIDEDLERVKKEWSAMIASMKTGISELANFRQTAVSQTKLCTAEAIEQYEFHMGFLRFYMNKNEQCRA